MTDTNEPKQADRNRPTMAPGGCECSKCGCIFIGGETHTECGICANEPKQAPAVEAGARDERAWEDYLDEQKRILGMPGLHSRPCFLAGYHAALASASEAATTDPTRERIAQALHYPACWDTAAYPTLESAVWESIACAKLGCSECGGASEAKQPTERGASIYVECRECVECGHIGINDSHDTDAACGYPCGWTGPSPIEDKCPGCQRENVMGAACPKCSGRYSILAEARLPAAKLVSMGASEAATGEPVADAWIWCDTIYPEHCHSTDEDAIEEGWEPLYRTGYRSIPIDLLAKLLPGTYYMDPPDGGSVSVMDQLRRMAEDAQKWREHIAAPQPASEQPAWPASWNAIVPPPNDSALVFDDDREAASEQRAARELSDEQVKRAIDAWFTYSEDEAHDFALRMQRAILAAKGDGQ